MKDLLNFHRNILNICWKLFRFAADGLRLLMVILVAEGVLGCSLRGKAAGPFPLFLSLVTPISLLVWQILASRDPTA